MKLLRADHALAFLDGQDLVRFDMLQDGAAAAGPEDFETVRGCSPP